jgi:hypothetical protein
MITTIEYERRKRQVECAFLPKIYPCKKCGSPVASGYACGYCGDGEPYKVLE